MLNLSDDNKIFRGYATMKELYNALKCITMLFFIQKILTFNLGVAFSKSVSIQNISDELEIRPVRTKDCGVSSP